MSGVMLCPKLTIEEYCIGGYEIYRVGNPRPIYYSFVKLQLKSVSKQNTFFDNYFIIIISTCTV